MSEVVAISPDQMTLPDYDAKKIDGIVNKINNILKDPKAQKAMISYGNGVNFLYRYTVPFTDSLNKAEAHMLAERYRTVGWQSVTVRHEPTYTSVGGFDRPFNGLPVNVLTLTVSVK